MRSVSSALRQAAYGAETGEVFLLLVTLDHADLAAPIRVSSDAVDTVSRGDTYTAFPFEISLPDDREDAPPRVQLSIDNVDRQVVAAVRSVTSPPTVTLEVVLASAPDTVEAGPFAMSLTRVSYDALTVTGDLGFSELLDEPFPAQRFTPGRYPGLF